MKLESHHIKITSLIEQGKLESQKIIDQQIETLSSFRQFEGFSSSLLMPDGQESFVKSMDSRERKVHSIGLKNKTGAFADGELNDDCRYNICFSEEELYSTKHEKANKFFKTFEKYLEDQDGLGNYLLFNSTEIVNRSNGYFCINLVFKKPDGKTMEVQLLTKESQIAKKLDDPLYAEAQLTCNRLIDLMPVPITLKPNYFYEILDSEPNLPSEDLVAQLEIENSPRSLHLIQKIKTIYLKSKKNFAQINRPTEKYINKMKKIIKKYTAFDEITTKSDQIRLQIQKARSDSLSYIEKFPNEIDFLGHS